MSFMAGDYCIHHDTWVREHDRENTRIATLGQLVDFYCKHHGQPPSCGYGGPRRPEYGAEAVLNNVPHLVEAMIERRCNVVTVEMALRFAGEALNHLTNADGIDIPADVRGARAIRVLSEFVTLLESQQKAD